MQSKGEDKKLRTSNGNNPGSGPRAVDAEQLRPLRSTGGNTIISRWTQSGVTSSKFQR